MDINDYYFVWYELCLFQDALNVIHMNADRISEQRKYRSECDRGFTEDFNKMRHLGVGIGIDVLT